MLGWFLIVHSPVTGQCTITVNVVNKILGMKLISLNDIYSIHVCHSTPYLFCFMFFKDKFSSKNFMEKYNVEINSILENFDRSMDHFCKSLVIDKAK